MKVSTYTKTIPEQKVEVTEYIACDGKKFYTEEDCKCYEERLLQEQERKLHDVFKSERRITVYPDEESGTLYYIKSDEEYDLLMQYLRPGKAEQDDYKSCGPGFYIYIWEDGGDGLSDYYRLFEVNKYMDLIELELKNFKYEVEELIDDIKYDLSEPEDPDFESL